MQHRFKEPDGSTWRIGGAFAAALLLGGTLAPPAMAATVLKRGLVGPVTILDPQKAATTSETALLLDLFEGLVTRDAAGKIAPGVASSWTVSPDGLAYTFTLRDGARWSNGDVVKAADFVASFRRLFDPATEATDDGPLQAIANASAVKSGAAKPDTLGVTANDEKTLTIRLDRVTPTFLERLAAPVALPVNVTAGRKLGTDYASGAKLISNGAYMLGTTGARTGYVLARNPRWNGADTPAIDSVIYRPFDGAASCVTAFRAGEVDICPDVPTENLSDLKAEFGDALHVSPYAGTYFYVVNQRKKPFDDPRIRRALSLAVDRNALAAKAWSGGMLPADDLVPAGLAPTDPAPAPPLAARRDEARSLIAAAGFGPGKPPLKLAIRVGSGMAHEATADLVIDDWKTIGVDGRVVSETDGSHFAALRDGADFDLAWSGWIADEPNALAMLDILKSDSRFNYGRYANREFDRLIASADIETDPEKRKAALADADRLVATDAPVIPLLSYAALGLVSPKVKGWTDNLVDQHPSRLLGLADTD
ncbi:peptide ABC transporter substrate-binding protein [Mesorhizobium sp. BR1-1-16]|uniref:peptide ABC transporter substrate-binding protein n=1 Tax=Mesorhizobium sp. BR1-1-16 TaxID=2876653 RepID=UPI001CCA36B8|nr:peptide ABC transporter substrate-binding protein [Mesorhizobium sp. BR1-1-16]MBZ9936470.1 peptide ABC transporter substrate-binding protein [Mesorhizobium sp. BR1-1-16]